MAHTRIDKATARLRRGLPISKKQRLLIKKRDNRLNCWDWETSEDRIKYKMRKALILLFVVQVAFACKAPAPATNTIYKTKYEKEIIRDTLVQVKIKPMYVEKETRDTISILNTDNATSLAKITGGVLFHRLEQKGEVEVLVKYVDKFTTDTIYVGVSIEKGLTWWQGLWVGLGKLFLIIASIFLIYLVIKIIK